jgi:hypothetical protein
MVEQEHRMLVMMAALIQQVLVVLQVMIAPLEVKEDMQVVEKEEMVEMQNNQHKMEILEKQVVENGKTAQTLGLEELLVVMVLQFVKEVVYLGLLELTQEQ